jgi:hypothetical protein
VEVGCRQIKWQTWPHSFIARLALTTAASDLAFSHPRIRQGYLPLSSTLSSGRGIWQPVRCFLCSHQSYPSLNNTSNPPTCATFLAENKTCTRIPSCRPQLSHLRSSASQHANYTACTTTSFSYAGAAAKASITHCALHK